MVRDGLGQVEALEPCVPSRWPLQRTSSVGLGWGRHKRLQKRKSFAGLAPFIQTGGSGTGKRTGPQVRGPSRILAPRPSGVGEFGSASYPTSQVQGWGGYQGSSMISNPIPHPRLINPRTERSACPARGSPGQARPHLPLASV